MHDKAFYDSLARQAEKLNESEKYNEVIRLIDRYKDLANHSNLLDKLAFAYGKIGKIDFAISLFERALELDPINIDAYYNLGGIYGYIKKDKAKGIKCFMFYIEH